MFSKFVGEFLVVVDVLLGDFPPLLLTWVHLSSLLAWSPVSVFCGLVNVAVEVVAVVVVAAVYDGNVVFLVVF